MRCVPHGWAARHAVRAGRPWCAGPPAGASLRCSGCRPIAELATRPCGALRSNSCDESDDEARVFARAAGRPALLGGAQGIDRPAPHAGLRGGATAPVAPDCSGDGCHAACPRRRAVCAGPRIGAAEQRSGGRIRARCCLSEASSARPRLPRAAQGSRRRRPATSEQPGAYRPPPRTRPARHATFTPRAVPARQRSRRRPCPWTPGPARPRAAPDRSRARRVRRHPDAPRPCRP